MNFLDKFLREVKATVTDSETSYVFQFCTETERLMYSVDESDPEIRDFVQDIRDYIDLTEL